MAGFEPPEKPLKPSDNATATEMAEIGENGEKIILFNHSGKLRFNYLPLSDPDNRHIKMCARDWRIL